MQHDRQFSIPKGREEAFFFLPCHYEPDTQTAVLRFGAGPEKAATALKEGADPATILPYYFVEQLVFDQPGKPLNTARRNVLQHCLKLISLVAGISSIFSYFALEAAQLLNG